MYCIKIAKKYIHTYIHILFLLIELSSPVRRGKASSKILPEPTLYPQIHFYEDGNGHIHPISGHVDVGIEGNYIMGIVIDGLLRPAFDAHQQRIIVWITQMHNFPLNNSAAEGISFGYPPQQTAPAILKNIGK